MKLAFCLFKYFPYGGLQRDFLRFAKACLAKGHDIHVYTMAWEGAHEPSFHLHLLPSSGLQNHQKCQSFCKQLGIELQKNHYDVVIGFNKMPNLDIYYAADVCYKARALEKHGIFYRLLPRYRQLKAFEQAVFDPAKLTEIVLISPLEQTKFIEHYQTPVERFHLLPPAIKKADLKDYQQTRVIYRAQCKIEPQEYLLLIVGSGFKTKGLDRAILSLAALGSALRKRCHLYVIGQDHPEAFNALAKRKGVKHQLHFLGARDDVPAWMQAADLLLHPAYHENTGTVILEALTHGLPVLTLSNCGYAHYVEKAKAGMVLVSPFSQKKWNEALTTMLTQDSRSLHQQNAIEFSKTADIYENTDEFFSVLERAYQRKKLPVTSSLFTHLMTYKGEVVRAEPGRFTKKIEINEHSYFIKQHVGIGWGEILKNFLVGKFPILGAKNEWLALQALEQLGIHAPIALMYGEKGLNPAKRHSFIIMEEIKNTISLEEVTKNWLNAPPDFLWKRQLIRAVAELANAMHCHGMNHRDFYLCHFLLDLSVDPQCIKLFLIDLHRASIRHTVPKRWLIKDLAGLYFSSQQIGLTKRDLLYFIKCYSGQPLSSMKISQHVFWRKVKHRGDKLYHKHQ